MRRTEGSVVHAEEHQTDITEKDLQEMLFRALKCETGDHRKIKITYYGKPVLWPLQVEWHELLEGDWRVKLGVSNAKGQPPLNPSQPRSGTKPAVTTNVMAGPQPGAEGQAPPGGTD